MIKKRYFSTNENFKTCFLYKFFLLLGIILLSIFVFFKVTTLFIDKNSEGLAKQIYDFSQSNYPNSILALSIIILAVSVIFYFFYCQFVKLAKIADEIENEEESNDLIEE
jgi:ABC-type spermidine/putrescine transport system permease subunit II